MPHCDQLHSVFPSNQWVLKQNFRDLEFSVNGVTTEELFNRGLVNKKLLEDNYHNLPRILHLESKRKPWTFSLKLQKTENGNGAAGNWIKNNEDDYSNLFITIEALLGKCNLPSEDDNDFRGKAVEFLISTESKNE